jgi:hypothetical protein
VALTNRVTPLGEIVAAPERGLVYGNRGCLHDARGRVVRHHTGRRWITCRLEFRGWHRTPVPARGRYTALFFLDEATAFAAGHRPCALCRRADYERLAAILGLGGAEAIDAQLHRERLGPRASAALRDLPDGAFVLHAGEPHLVVTGLLRRWTHGGYESAAAASGVAEVITPPSLLRVLRAGWEPLVPFLHPSAASALR